MRAPNLPSNHDSSRETRASPVGSGKVAPVTNEQVANIRMRKSHSRKNLDNTVEPDGSMHGSAKGVSRSLSNMKLSRALSASAGKGDHDVSW